MDRRVVRKARSTHLHLCVMIAAAVVCVTGATHPMAAPQNRPSPRAANQNDPNAIGVFPLRGDVYALVGTGGNVTVQVGPEGVLVIDAGTAAMTAGILAAIEKLSDQPIRWLINTSLHSEHTAGNEALFKAGVSTAQNQFGSGRAFPGSLPTGATIVAHENVLKRMSTPTAGQTLIPQAGWPVATYFGAKRELYFNGEAIEVIHQPNAVTDGDSVVAFRHADLVLTGDIFVTTGYPLIDVKNGGTINGEIDALNNIIDMTIPGEKQEGGTYVVPGHGRICDESDVVTYRHMVTIIRDRIQDLMSKGMTLEQVKAAKPTADYDPRWATPAWTGDMFVEAAYRTLAPLPSAGRQSSGR